MTRKKSTKKPSAAFFAVLPRALQLACLAMLPLEDILAFDATSHTMRQLCAEDVLWRFIYEDVVSRCALEGEEHMTAERERSLVDHKNRVEDRTAYKYKTLTHLLAFFHEEKKRALEIVCDALEAEREASSCDCECHYDSDSDSECECHTRGFGDFDYTYNNWGEDEWDADEQIEKLEEHCEAIRKALAKRT